MAERQYKNMSNEEYREGLKELFDGIENNDLLKYFYIFCTEYTKE